MRHLRRLSSAARLQSGPGVALAALLNSTRSFLQRDFAARLAACGTPPDKVEVTLKAIFSDADQQKRGVLPLEGVVDAIRMLKEKCTLSKAALDAVTAVRHFERADANNDGVLSFEEFQTYVTQNILAHAYGERLSADADARRSAASRECRLSQNPIIERCVATLVPGINENGVHHNRMLLFGGAAPSSDAMLMRSNDYLNLSGHPTIAAARAEAMLNEAGGGSGSSGGTAEESRPRVFTMAEIDRHRALELRLASLLQAEDAALTMSGAHAVVGLLKTMRGGMRADGGGPRIYADRLSWTSASLRYDLGGAIVPFPHNDMGSLHALARDEPGVIVVDALYGNGTVGQLERAADIAEATGSVLLVDETHAFGCASGGLGLVDELGLTSRVHFRTIGFSKAMAARGGAIIGPSRALEAFRFNDSTMIFSTAPKSHEAVGWDATLDVLLSADGEDRRRALHRNHEVLRAGLLALGLDDHVGSSNRQILTIVTGDAQRTEAFRDACAARGVFGAVFCPPFAQEGRTFVRFTVHAGLDEAQLDHFFGVMKELRHLLP